MSREDIVAVASRLFAVFLVVVVLRMASGIFHTLPTFESTARFVLFLGFATIPALAIAALLWFFPLSVAKRLLPVMKTPRPPVDAASPTAMELALTAMGFWLLAGGLIDAIYWIVMVIHIVNTPMSVELDASQKANLVATITQLALGLWLLLGHRGLTNLVLKLRYAGSRGGDQASDRTD